MEYNNYSAALETLKAKQTVALEANNKVCANIQQIIERCKDFDISIAETYNINLNLFETVDVDRLSSDYEYVESLKQSISTEVEKIKLILKDVLE